MPLDPRARRFLGLLAASNPQSMRDAAVADRRIALVELMKFGGPPPPIGAVEDRSMPGPGGPLGLRVYTPAEAPRGGAAALPGLVYFHGGGFVAGTLATHDSIARALANAGACRVVSVDYRLAPEHRFPAALEDALAAVSHVSAAARDFGIDPARIGICGDSAGGTLAAAACQAIAQAGRPALALQVLLCPILDYSRLSPSRHEFAHGYLVDEAVLAHDLRLYLPDGADPGDARVSPLRGGAVAGLPRTLIHTAECDPLRDEGRDYFEQLSHAGCDVAYTCHPGMIHLFYGLGSVIPHARSAFAQIGGEIRAALG
jgi:acetyl esterase/lipase